MKSRQMLVAPIAAAVISVLSPTAFAVENDHIQVAPAPLAPTLSSEASATTPPAIAADSELPQGEPLMEVSVNLKTGAAVVGVETRKPPITTHQPGVIESIANALHGAIAWLFAPLPLEETPAPAGPRTEAARQSNEAEAFRLAVNAAAGPGEPMLLKAGQTVEDARAEVATLSRVQPEQGIPVATELTAEAADVAPPTVSDPVAVQAEAVPAVVMPAAVPEVTVVSAAPAPESQGAAVTRQWELVAGETVDGQLQAWAKASGWQLNWKLDKSWRVAAPVTLSGDFQSVMEQVITALYAEGHPLRLNVWAANRYAEVIHVAAR